MKKKMKLTPDEQAVSPVIGVMLMLVATIVLAAAVSSFSGGLVTTSGKAPQASFDVKIRDDSTTGWSTEFVMKHLGGDPVVTDDVKLVTKWTDSSGALHMQETTAAPMSDSPVIYYDKWTSTYTNVTGVDNATNIYVDLSDSDAAVSSVDIAVETGGTTVDSTTLNGSGWYNITVASSGTYNITVNYAATEGSGVNYKYSVPVNISDGNETHVSFSLTIRTTRYADVNTKYADYNSNLTLYHAPYLVIPGDMPAEGTGREDNLWFGNYTITRGDVVKAQINLMPGTGGWQNQATPIIKDVELLERGDVVTVELIDLNTNNKIFSKDVVVR